MVHGVYKESELSMNYTHQCFLISHMLVYVLSSFPHTGLPSFKHNIRGTMHCTGGFVGAFVVVVGGRVGSVAILHSPGCWNSVLKQ